MHKQTLAFVHAVVHVGKHLEYMRGSWIGHFLLEPQEVLLSQLHLEPHLLLLLAARRHRVISRQLEERVVRRRHRQVVHQALHLHLGQAGLELDLWLADHHLVLGCIRSLLPAELLLEALYSEVKLAVEQALLTVVKDRLKQLNFVVDGHATDRITGFDVETDAEQVVICQLGGCLAEVLVVPGKASLCSVILLFLVVDTVPVKAQVLFNVGLDSLLGQELVAELLAVLLYPLEGLDEVPELLLPGVHVQDRSRTLLQVNEPLTVGLSVACPRLHQRTGFLLAAQEHVSNALP